MIDISKHITMKEAIRSDLAILHKINNVPDIYHIKAMQYVAQTVFEPLRAGLGNNPIEISSFYRCTELNSLPEINGSPTGHPTGECIDLKAMDGRKNSEIFYYILKYLPFDQLIWEFGDENEPAWVHVSLRKGRNRSQALIAYIVIENGKKKKKYKPFKT